jgi:hypothetical protein
MLLFKLYTLDSGMHDLNGRAVFKIGGTRTVECVEENLEEDQNLQNYFRSYLINEGCEAVPNAIIARICNMI